MLSVSQYYFYFKIGWTEDLTISLAINKLVSTSAEFVISLSKCFLYRFSKKKNFLNFSKK